VSSALFDGIFYVPQICDMGWRLYLPSEERHAEKFFALKNPTASAGFDTFPLVCPSSFVHYNIIIRDFSKAPFTAILMLIIIRSYNVKFGMHTALWTTLIISLSPLLITFSPLIHPFRQSPSNFHTYLSVSLCVCVYVYMYIVSSNIVHRIHQMC
jgi:hypothetical protein